MTDAHGRSVFRWGTVSSTDPLEVTLDGRSVALPVTQSLVDPLTLSVSDRVRCEWSGRRLIIHGRAGGLNLETIEDEIDALSVLAAAGANKIINGDFRVNQRGSSSGASLASGVYFLDRWRSGTSTNPTTWTGDDTTGRTLTIPSGERVEQIVERTNLPAGRYVLAWDGTATGRIYNSGSTAPSYAAGPIVVDIDGSANVIVAFTNGTVSKVRLYPGEVDYGFYPRLIGDELTLCQRYYARLTGTVRGQRLALGFQRTTTQAAVYIQAPVPMRSAPSVALASMMWSDDTTFDKAITSISVSASHPTMVVIAANWSGAAGAQFRPGGVWAETNTPPSYIELDAEL